MVRAPGKRALFGQAVEVSRLPVRSDDEGAAHTRQRRSKTLGPGMTPGMERDGGRCAGSCTEQTRADSAILGGPGVFT